MPGRPPLRFSGMLDRRCHQLHHVIVGQPIIEHLPFPPIGHQIGDAQQAHLMAGRRFTDAEQRRQVAHAHLLDRQGIDDGQAARIGQRLEQITDRLHRRQFLQGSAGFRDTVLMDNPAFASVFPGHGHLFV